MAMIFSISDFKKKFFSGREKNKNSEKKFSEPDLNIDIPRYPPFLEGLPFADPHQLLYSQKELVDRLRLSCGLNELQYRELLEPMLLRYASFVHLLPASEIHHHRGVGGLLRHGLEVAYLALRSSDSVIFSFDDTPQERRLNEPRWRFACCTAGLMHDLGKPITDMTVTDENGGLEWNPLTENLYDWLRENRLKKYFLHWRPNRHLKHEEAGILGVESVITPEVKKYLRLRGSTSIIESVLHAVSHTATDEPLVKIVLKADSDSVEKDRLCNCYDPALAMVGLPADRYIFDAIRQLVSSGKWKINVPGGAVLYMKDGTYIDWSFFRDVTALLDDEKIPGIPRSKETVADLIIDSGAGIANVTDGHRYRYFEIMPDLSPTVKVLALKIDSIDRIYSGALPNPLDNLLELREQEETAAAVPELKPETENSALSEDPQVKQEELQEDLEIPEIFSAVQADSTLPESASATEPDDPDDGTESSGTAAAVADELSAAGSEVPVEPEETVKINETEAQEKINSLPSSEHQKNSLPPEPTVNKPVESGCSDLSRTLDQELRARRKKLSEAKKSRSEKTPEIQKSSEKTSLSQIPSLEISRSWEKIFQRGYHGGDFLREFFLPILSHTAAPAGIYRDEQSRLIADLGMREDLELVVSQLASDRLLGEFSGGREVMTSEQHRLVRFNSSFSRAMLREFKQQALTAESFEKYFSENSPEPAAEPADPIGIPVVAGAEQSAQKTVRTKSSAADSREVESCINEMIDLMTAGSSCYFERVEVLDDKRTAVPVDAFEQLIATRYPKLKLLNVRRSLRDPKLKLKGLLNISRQKVILEALFENKESDHEDGEPSV